MSWCTRPERWRRRLLAALALAAAATAYGGQAELPALKAAYTYYFSKFVSWPGTPPNPLQLCVATSDSELRHQFSSLGATRVEEQTIAIVPLDPDTASTDRLDVCHILYLGQDLNERWAALLAAPRSGLLVVADDKAVIDSVAIRFIVRDERLLFAIDQQRARASGLTLSAQLISLGHRS